MYTVRVVIRGICYYDLDQKASSKEDAKSLAEGSMNFIDNLVYDKTTKALFAKRLNVYFDHME